MRSGQPRPLLRRARVALWLGLLPGCALVLDASSDTGDRCLFDGYDDELCGICLFEGCGNLIDACCGDVACSANLGLLDDCATGSSFACTDFFQHPDTPPDLAACAHARCLVDCTILFLDVGGGDASGGGGGGAAGSATSCVDEDFFCECTATEPGAGNDVTCEASPADDSACCASADWPDVGTLCICQERFCVEDASYCFCSFGATTGSTQSYCSASWLYCCLDPVDLECTCSDSACPAGERGVPFCDTDAIPCPEGTLAPSSCSSP